MTINATPTLSTQTTQTMDHVSAEGEGLPEAGDTWAKTKATTEDEGGRTMSQVEDKAVYTCHTVGREAPGQAPETQ